jgi:hypothetical protein
MLPKENIEQRVSELLVEMVSSHWNTTKKAYLMSALGMALRTKLPESRELLSGGLKNFLRQWPVAQRVEYPGVVGKEGLIPNGEPIPSDVKSLFEIKATNGMPSSPSGDPVYQDIFWSAFIRPVLEIRYVLIHPDSSISVADSLESDLNLKFYEITPSDISSAPPGMAIIEKAQLTHKKIKEWIEKNNLDLNIFLKHKTKMIPQSAVDKLSMLKSIFGDLSKEDQSRISIPMDILLKIVSQR